MELIATEFFFSTMHFSFGPFETYKSRAIKLVESGEKRIHILIIGTPL